MAKTVINGIIAKDTISAFFPKCERDTGSAELLAHLERLFHPELRFDITTTHTLPRYYSIRALLQFP